MATIFGVTSLELTEEQEKALSAALIKDLGTLYTHALSFYLSKIPQEDARGGAVDQITFFVCVPPYIPLEKKRQTIELLNNTMVREVGYKGEMKVIVLFSMKSGYPPFSATSRSQSTWVTSGLMGLPASS